MIIFQSVAPTVIKFLLCTMAGSLANMMTSRNQMETVSIILSLRGPTTGILLILDSSATRPDKTAIMIRLLTTANIDWVDTQNLGNQPQKDNDGFALMNNL